MDDHQKIQTSQTPQISKENVEKGFKWCHIKTEIFTEILASIDEEAVLLDWHPFPVNFDKGLLIMLQHSISKENSSVILGLIAFKIKYKLPSTTISSLNKNHKDLIKEKVVFKSKARHRDILKIISSMQLEGDGSDLQKLFIEASLAFIGSHLEGVELEFVKLRDPIIKPIIPDIYWTMTDQENDIFVYAMEYFQGPNYSLNPTDWTKQDILGIIHGLSVLHGRYYGLTDTLPEELTRCMKSITKEFMKQCTPICEKIIKITRKLYPKIITEYRYSLAMAIINNIDEIADILGKSPKTLIHRDCGVSNICIRKAPEEGQSVLCLHDFEFIAVGPSPIDIMYFLAPLCPDVGDMVSYIDQYAGFLKDNLLEKREEFLNHIGSEEFYAVCDAAMMWDFLRVISLSPVVLKLFDFYVDNLISMNIGHAESYITYVKHKYEFLCNL